jgi:tRNA (mo5U34)-methyltransferase
MISDADRRRAVDRWPWPNVRGKRCLDIGSVDGRVAAELRGRGGAEVVAITQTQLTTVYDLDPKDIGMFDIVVCDGALSQLHEPPRALEAIHRVTVGMLLSAEPIELWSSILGRGRPAVTPHDDDGAGPTFTFNGAGHKQLLEAAGFTVERVSKPYAMPEAVPRPPASRLRTWVDTLGMRAVTGSWAATGLRRALLARRRMA